MIDPGTATVAAALIGFSGHVLVAVISKHQTKPARRSYSEAGMNFDDEGVTKIMGQAQEHFRKLSSHIRSATQRILDVQAQALVTGVVDELQAQVSAVMDELKASQASAAGAKPCANLHKDRLNTAIIPLRAIIYRAKSTLVREGREDVWRLCCITGASALLSVSEYLETPEPTLLEDLKTAAKLVQRELLDALAYEIISKRGGSFPWDEVQEQRLLEPEGAKRLAELYKEHVQTQAPGGRASLAIDSSLISRLDAEEAVARINDETKLKTLEELKKAEKKGANRSKVIDVIDQRMVEVRAMSDLRKMLTSEGYNSRTFDVLHAATSLSKKDCRRLLRILGAKKYIEDGEEYWTLA